MTDSSKPQLIIAGASGVVGRHLVSAAKDRYDITVLTRKVEGDEPAGTTAVPWNPRAAREDDETELTRLAGMLSGANAVINLAGYSISGGRLDEPHKAKVLNSRLDSTNTLVGAFERAVEPPPVWFQASAVGYYGDRGNEELTEAAEPQDGYFLSEVSRHWENATEPVRDKTRVLIGRLGVVLAKDAEAWQRMVTPIKLFVGGPLGNGQQWFSWIDADDLASAILYLLEDSAARGVYNLTAPEPVRQLDLAKAAARQLGRPAFVPVPAFALRLALGGVADALLLSSAKVLPERLKETGFAFRNPDITSEMQKLLG